MVERNHQVLAFHHLDPRLDDYTNYHPTLFRELVERLIDRGVTFCTATEAASRPSDTRSVSLTFDDGYLSSVTRVLESEFASPLRTTHYLIANWIGRPNLWNHKAPYLVNHADHEMIRQLGSDGHELANHTASHQWLPKLSVDDIDREIWSAHDILTEITGAPPTSFAYPFGAHDERVRDMVARHYRHAYTTTKKQGGSNLIVHAMMLRRFTVTNGMRPSDLVERLFPLA